MSSCSALVRLALTITQEDPAPVPLGKASVESPRQLQQCANTRAGLTECILSG